MDTRFVADAPRQARHSNRYAGSDRDTVLLLTADTGGGHRAVASAIDEALHDRFDVVTAVCDPLTGPDTNRLLRTACRLYGPLTRVAPTLWAVLFHLTNITPVLWAVRWLVAASTKRLLAAQLGHHRVTIVVVTHPLLVDAAVVTRTRSAVWPRLVTVVTDLGAAHRSWWHPGVDRTIVPSAELLVAGVGRSNGLYPRALGLPVRGQFTDGAAPVPTSSTSRFVALVTGGGEGVRSMKSWVRALVGGLPDLDVVAICGRNHALRHALETLAAQIGGRLHVEGYVPAMADWLRHADVVVTKAGPGVIAEATATGVPLLLPTHIPGQETGNTELLVAHGAARRVHGARDLVRQVAALRDDPKMLARMATAARGFGRPHAASAVADVIASDATDDGADVVASRCA